MTNSTQELHLQSLSELANTLHSKKASAVEVAQHFLQRIQDDKTGSFLDVNAQATLAQAQNVGELPLAFRCHRGPKTRQRREWAKWRRHGHFGQTQLR